MPFNDNFWGDTPFLLITEAAPGSVVKSAFELLEIALPGQPDKLTLYYDAFLASPAAVNAALLALPAIGTDLSATAVTDGTWVAGPPKLETDRDQFPFARFSVPCLGLAESKPDAVRWFAGVEGQSGENILYLGTVWPKLQADVSSIGVEIDKVILGSAPNMAQVGTALTPPSAPSPATNPWTSIDDPTRHYPDGWSLADLRTQQLHGSALAWLATYVYRYKYALTP